MMVTECWGDMPGSLRRRRVADEPGPPGRVKGSPGRTLSSAAALGWAGVPGGRDAAPLAAGVRFGLLGPLAVCAGGLTVPITAAKQRVVLAALLLNAGRVVGVDELAEAVWGVAAPASARATLHNYVKRLRHALGDARRRCISTQPDGYLISVGSGELDVVLFESLQESGRRAARQREWEQAASHLRAALALWRGELLADVPSDRLLLQHGPRLAELRVQALEARMEADLQLGGHAEVITELRQLTGVYPLREHPYELLMLALYRDGRQAEALAAYQDARQALIGELGLEPGPGLRELQQHILSADPGLGVSADPGLGVRAAPRSGTGAAGSPGDARTTAPPSGHDGLATLVPAQPNGVMRNGGDPACCQAVSGHFVVPRQLPAGLARFAGRKAELAALMEMADAAGSMAGAGGETAAVTGGGVTIAAISGTAGVGKTALALHFAHRVVDRFPDGQLYVNLRGFDPSSAPLGIGEAIRTFLDALKVPPDQLPAGLDAQAGLYRSLLAGRRMLVVLDNAGDATQVRPLLPGDGGCLVVVTSRRQLTALAATDGARQVILDVLTGAEAHDLLAGRLGARLAAEPAAAEELGMLCARLPLALSIVAAQASARPGLPLAALAAVLRDARGRLDMLDGGEAAVDARAVFSWSCKQLSPSAARMFRLLGLHPGPDATVAAAASLAGISPGQACRAFAELTGACLLAEHAPGRYACHDLLRAYAAEQADAAENPAERQAAVERAVDHYLHTARAADKLLHSARLPIPSADPRPGTQPEHLATHAQALAWFDAEHKVLLAAIGLAARHGLDTQAWQLPWAMETFHHRRAYWHDWAATQRVGLAAARRRGDRGGQAHAHRGIANASIESRRYLDAEHHLTQAFRLCEQDGDVVGQACLHLDMARMHGYQGRSHDAHRHARQALELFRAAGVRAGEADALSGIGWCQCQLGDYTASIASCEQALQVYQQTGSRHQQGHTWDTLGRAHSQLGRHAEAAACYRHAVRILGELGNTYNTAETLSHSSDASRAVGDTSAARDALRQVLALLNDLHHPAAVARLLRVF